jgi:hypothetical protein
MKRIFAVMALAVAGMPALSARQLPVGDTAAAARLRSMMMGRGVELRKGPEPYNKLITAKARTMYGLFTVHRVDERVYFEIPDSVLGRCILVVTRLAKSGTDMRSQGSMEGFAGDEVNENLVRFEKGPDDRIFMRDLSFSERSSDSSQSMYQAVMNSNIQPIAQSFEVKSYHRDSANGMHSSVIDMTEVINGDNDILFLGPAKMKLRLGGYQADKSYLEDVRTFPINTEIRTIKTYGAASGGGGGPLGALLGGGGAAGGTHTVELNTSMVLLPAVPMRPRYADDRVGYFTDSYTDFDADPQGVKRTTMITRWRLEPKPEDMERYKRGELVEPAKPIVIYIDPATPKKWVPYLIQGINDWQAAFETAGFKNAIVGKMAPTPQEDPSWNLDDATHSALIYKASAIANASGPHVSDPRSGEIIETHINWYHDVMSLVHDWYMIQAAAIDPRARKMEFDDELMGQLIRFVSSHEIGHTLGLTHNFGSSSTTPVEKLRDKAWVEAHGHTPSIMDYARFNYVAQPEDGIGEKGIFPRIGDYDKWAIEWGYRLVPEAATAKEEKPVLNKWLVNKLKDHRYWYGPQLPMGVIDPRSQNEDLGDDAMKASMYGIRNMKVVLSHLPEWTREPNEDYQGLGRMYKALINEVGQFVGHVSSNIGGIYITEKTVEQPGPVFEPVPAEVQHSAMTFLNREVFATPEWLLDKRIMQLTGAQPDEVVTALQGVALSRVLSTERMDNLIHGAELVPGAYKLTDLFSDLQKGIWTELGTRHPIDVYRRNLQKVYIDRLDAILNPTPGQGQNPMAAMMQASTRGADAKSTDISSVIRGHLVALRASIRTALPGTTDEMTRYHLQDMSDRIDRILHPQSAK